MKKPNITKGKWNNEVDVVYSDKEGLVADCSYIKGKDIDTVNAKAISAVPDMIDELIEAKNWIDGKIIITHDFGGEERMKKAISNRIESALKKAGCTE